jgi:hypothetical protein
MRRLVLPVLLMLSVLVPAHAEELLATIPGSGLYRIDPASGAAIPILSLSAAWHIFDVDRATQRAFVETTGASGVSIVDLLRRTSTPTPVPWRQDFRFDPAHGDLIATHFAGGTVVVSRFNLTTGAETLITSLPATQAAAVAFDPATRRLFLRVIVPSTWQLEIVNVDTGAVTVTGADAFGNSYVFLDGKLLRMDYDTSWKLFEVNVVTGVLTPIADLGPALQIYVVAADPGLHRVVVTRQNDPLSISHELLFIDVPSGHVSAPLPWSGAYFYAFAPAVPDLPALSFAGAAILAIALGFVALRATTS